LIPAVATISMLRRPARPSSTTLAILLDLETLDHARADSAGPGYAVGYDEHATEIA